MLTVEKKKHTKFRNAYTCSFVIIFMLIIFSFSEFYHLFASPNPLLLSPLAVSET